MGLESMQIEQMIARIRSYGLIDEKVFSAMRAVRRSSFVEGYSLQEVYGDHPLGIGLSQTISQPYTVAFMLHALELELRHKVLEIGSGSGWVLALIKRIVEHGKVFGIEVNESLVVSSRKRLARLSIDAEIHCGDGSLGLVKRAPFDRIIVSAACPSFPAHLLSQLKEGGILLAPVGRHTQAMMRARKDGKESFENLGGFSFVPLQGRHGFRMNEDAGPEG